MAIVASAILVLFGIYSAAGTSHTNTDLKKRLAYCGSIPNGSSLTVVQTTRLFIFLPKDYFPSVKLKMTAHNASAIPVYLGAYGYAQSRDAKSGCWSYALDFELAPNSKTQSGTVDIGSKSAYKTVSSYLIHFKVVVDHPSATKQLPGNGTVLGNVILGPTCPVERIPPDPACAPRPYKTTIDIWNTFTGSSYQSVSTDSGGVFKLSLAPGSYSLEASKAANGSPYPRCAQVNISVAANRSQNVTLNCDTGIR